MCQVIGMSLKWVHTPTRFVFGICSMSVFHHTYQSKHSHWFLVHIQILCATSYPVPPTDLSHSPTRQLTAPLPTFRATLALLSVGMKNGYVVAPVAQETGRAASQPVGVGSIVFYLQGGGRSLAVSGLAKSPKIQNKTNKKACLEVYLLKKQFSPTSWCMHVLEINSICKFDRIIHLFLDISLYMEWSCGHICKDIHVF